MEKKAGEGERVWELKEKVKTVGEGGAGDN